MSNRKRKHDQNRRMHNTRAHKSQAKRSRKRTRTDDRSYLSSVSREAEEIREEHEERSDSPYAAAAEFAGIDPTRRKSASKAKVQREGADANVKVRRKLAPDAKRRVRDIAIAAVVSVMMIATMAAPFGFQAMQQKDEDTSAETAKGAPLATSREAKLATDETGMYDRFLLTDTKTGTTVTELNDTDETLADAQAKAQGKTKPLTPEQGGADDAAGNA